MTAALGRRPDRAAPPVRLVHLGLGNFFRAHQAWYTDQAGDADRWGIAAFTGHSRALAEQLTRQGGCYTLVIRGADGDRFEPVSSVAAAFPGTDHAAWLRHLAAPDVAAVTLTITEAGYRRDPTGGLDRAAAEVRADVAALKDDPAATVRTAPARLVAGLLARRHADAGPLTLLPCDNLPSNGAATLRVVREFAELVDPQLVDWLEHTVTVATTMVDRITPRTTADDVRAVTTATGLVDRCPVVTEPFHEWVLSGVFPAGRPRWEDAGARFTDDVEPYEQRKLWLLNGAHSLLAYAGSIRGHRTVAEAVADDTCAAWLQAWWEEASRHLHQPAAELAAYRSALLDRFTNPRIRHRLDQIAADGSQKLPVRVLPVLAAEVAAGRVPRGAVHLLAAWICHLRGLGAPVQDPRAAELLPLAGGSLPDAVRRVLAVLDAGLADDDAIVSAVVDAAGELAPG